MLIKMVKKERLSQRVMRISDKKVYSYSAKETEVIGEKIGLLLEKGDFLALRGELGSGKTTLTKGIARGLEIEKPEYVNSPSFVIANEYRGKINLYHFDLYRLDDLVDIEYLGVEDYLEGDGVVVIEWADKMKQLVPEAFLEISIEIVDEYARVFKLSAKGKRYEDIIDRYFKQ
ncbi:MAG: tRNA (adenosine(37)-N6)-threonylcarbamoyltransferase complex ATPase subunit type 1 TsaE [Candidatus Omnitrophota bacterium]